MLFSPFQLHYSTHHQRFLRFTVFLLQVHAGYHVSVIHLNFFYYVPDEAPGVARPFSRGLEALLIG